MALKKSKTFSGIGVMKAREDEAEIVHWGHPKHALVQMSVVDVFTCAGCKECGSGKRFVCPYNCDYQIHHFCANAPASLASHPLHSRHLLLLFSKPAKSGSKCELCYKACKGYTFRCNACSFQIHPCCAMLAPEIRLPSLHPHNLRLLASEASLPQCSDCNRRRPGRLYRCTACDYAVHAACAKTAVNGLRENGFKDQKPNNMLDSAARLASQVMTNFIGGLIEGIAEGVGQVIAQDALKGQRTRSASTSPSKRSSKSSNKKGSD